MPHFLTCKCRASSLCSPVGGTAYASNRANSRPEVTSNRAQQEIAHCLPTFCSDPYYILSLSGKLQIYNLFSVFLLFRPASLQMSDDPDLLYFDVESTNPWPIRENLRTSPIFMTSLLARVRISCFRKTTFTSSPVPCNLLKLSELRVKTLFFFVLSQLSDL